MTEAGWYEDPNVPGTLRYWDGTAWTEHTHTPEPPAPVEQSAPVQPVPAPRPIPLDAPASAYAGLESQPPETPSRRSRQGPGALVWLAIIIGIIGILVGVVAIIYYTVPAHSLPSILGPVPNAKPHVHRVHRGQSAAILAGGLLVLALVVGIVAWRTPKASGGVGRRLLGR